MSVPAPQASGKQLLDLRGGWEKEASNHRKTNSSPATTDLAPDPGKPSAQSSQRQAPWWASLLVWATSSSNKQAVAKRRSMKTCVKLQQGLMPQVVDFGTTSFAFRSVTHHFNTKATQDINRSEVSFPPAPGMKPWALTNRFCGPPTPGVSGWMPQEPQVLWSAIDTCSGIGCLALLILLTKEMKMNSSLQRSQKNSLSSWGRQNKRLQSPQQVQQGNWQ